MATTPAPRAMSTNIAFGRTSRTMDGEPSIARADGSGSCAVIIFLLAEAQVHEQDEQNEQDEQDIQERGHVRLCVHCQPRLSHRSRSGRKRVTHRTIGG